MFSKKKYSSGSRRSSSCYHLHSCEVTITTEFQVLNLLPPVTTWAKQSIFANCNADCENLFTRINSTLILQTDARESQILRISIHKQLARNGPASCKYSKDLIVMCSITKGLMIDTEYNPDNNNNKTEKKCAMSKDKV
jgi:hypothetical protein